MLKLKNNMKAIAITLLALVWVLLANVIAVFVSPEYKAWIQSKIGTRQSLEISSLETPAATKLSDTLDRLSYGIEALSGTGGTTQTGATIRPSSSGSSASGNVVSPVSVATPIAPVIPPKPEPTIYPLSVLLQAKMIPDVTPKIVENKGIFDIRIFTSLGYTTYRDDKNRVNIYAFSESYPVILTNLKLVSNVYAIKETDTFFEASFFLNPTNKRDTTIRFVTSIAGKAYGFEIPKIFYPRIKKLLTNT
jgi:hypothetical protein